MLPKEYDAVVVFGLQTSIFQLVWAGFERKYSYEFCF